MALNNISIVALPLLIAYLISASTAAQKPDPPIWYTEQELSQMTPASANPYLAFLPEGVEPDFDYWRSYAKIEGEKRAKVRSLFGGSRAVAFAESEPNNTQATANFISGFGTDADPTAFVIGNLSTSLFPLPIPFPREDNGSIPLATLLLLSAGNSVTADAVLGDGPHGRQGTGNGDFDFYKVPGVSAGQKIAIDITTADNGLFVFDSFVTVWNSAGAILAYNDDENSGIWDSFLEFTAPAAGTYYISVGAWSSETPADPFDSSSGFGAASEGPYNIVVGIDSIDTDYFAVSLQAGDIFGASLFGAGSRVTLYDPSGTELMGSGQDLSFYYPLFSPLPGGGNATLAYVVNEAGTYGVRVSGTSSGAYTLQLGAFRSIMEKPGTSNHQILFIDFDGADLNSTLFGDGCGCPHPLSPLSSFLSGWGLGPSDEDAVIDAILAVVEEDLNTDIRFPGGLNPKFNIEIRNSRDHADPTGQPNVSRVIVGGTIAESGIFTLGIAESIDVGNFKTTDNALVLLDLLSAPPSNPNSLSRFPRHPSASIIDIVGVGVGNIVAHEAGHFFGDYHTENFWTLPNIMDQGGSLANMIGIGRDRIFGTADDIDVDFGVDIYVPNEGFTGIEDTLNTIAFALSGTRILNLDMIYVDFAAGVNGTGQLAQPFDNLSSALDVANPGATIRIFPSSSSETFSGASRIDQPVTIVNFVPAGGSVTIGTP